MPDRYRKKPVEIEARQLLPMPETWRISTHSGGNGCVSVTVIEEADNA